MHVWVGLDSDRWDVEWSNNKDNELVECFRDVFLTQTVKKIKLKKTRKRERHTSNLLGLVLVNEESMVSGIEHWSPGKMIMKHWYSHYYMCVKKSKRNKNKNLSMI